MCLGFYGVVWFGLVWFGHRTILTRSSLSWFFKLFFFGLVEGFVERRKKQKETSFARKTSCLPSWFHVTRRASTILVFS